MRKNSGISQSSVFNPRTLIAFSLCSAAALLAMFSFATPSSDGPYPRPGVTVKMLAANAGSTFSNSPVGMSADGRYLAFNGAFPFGCCVVGIYDRQTGTTDTPASSTADGTIALNADGRYLAFNTNGYDADGAEDVYRLDRQTGALDRVSVAPDGSPPTCTGGGCVHSSWYPAISADGRHVAFYSFATNLITGDTQSPSNADVFVRDMQTGVTERVSVASDGTQGNGLSVEPSISADGRYVAFRSFATNLVTGNTNTGSSATCSVPGQTSTTSDVYLHDRQTGTTELVSVGIGGTQDGCSWQPSISGDGRFVAFVSSASNLVPIDTNKAWDVFVRDRQTGRTERVSVTPDGAQGTCAPSSCRCGAPSISADGRYVVFHTFQSLVSDDVNQTGDIYIHDRETGSTERVSLAYPGEQVPGEPPGNANSTSGPNAANGPGVSSDGRIVLFDSFAADLVLNDGWNNPSKSYTDVFMRDRGPALGIGALSATCRSKPVTASGWATYSGGIVVSADDPPNDGLPIAASVGAELIGASIAYRPEQADLFLRLRVTSLIDGVGGAPGVLYGFKIRIGPIHYEVRATEAEGFALYNCDPSSPICTQIASLSGSIGASGNEVTVSVPFSALNLLDGDVLYDLGAYTAFGNAAAGPTATLDDVALPSPNIGTYLPVHYVRLGIAPPGTPASGVAFTIPAALTGANFSANLPPLIAGNYNVWARDCLGNNLGNLNVCGTAVSTPLTVTDACATPPVQLNSVVSRKTHGTAGTFDINLPLTGNPGIECRSGGANGQYTLVFTFANPLTNVEQALFGSPDPGPGTEIFGSIDGSDARNYIVTLFGITKPQVVNIVLHNVTDSVGDFSEWVPASMGVLLGDTNGNGLVNSTDISETQAQSGQAVTSSNFRTDVNTNGLINSTDVSIVQSKSGTGLP